MIKVLIVDDCGDIAEGLAAGLLLEGHESKAAQSGERAICVCESFSPDIAFVDVAMPGMLGDELAHLLKHQFPAIRLIAVTGLPPLGVYRCAVFERYERKPFSIQAACRVIQECFAAEAE